MPIDAFEKTKDPSDIGSEFLTKEEKAELRRARKADAQGAKKEAKPKRKKKK